MQPSSESIKSVIRSTIRHAKATVTQPQVSAATYRYPDVTLRVCDLRKVIQHQATIAESLHSTS